MIRIEHLVVFGALRISMDALAEADRPAHHTGESYAMETNWFPARLNGQITEVAPAGVLAVPLSAAGTSEGVLVSGSLGVFFHGNYAAAPAGDQIASDAPIGFCALD